MTRVICVQSVRYDLLEQGFRGTVVYRRDEGELESRNLTVPGDPTWTYGEAARALCCEAAAGCSGGTAGGLDRAAPLP